MEYFLGLGLTFGGTLSYGAAIFTIVRCKSSDGVSETSIALNFMANYFQMLNATIINLSFWWASGWISLLPYIQILSGSVYCSILYTVIFLYRKKRRWMVLKTLLILFIVGSVTLSLIFVHPLWYARVVGLASTTLTFVTWLPQIRTSWVTKKPEELNICFIGLELIGSMISVFYQGFYAHEDWSLWMADVVMSVDLIIILGILFFRRKYGKKYVEDSMECDETVLPDTIEYEMDILKNKLELVIIE
jgi:uncharacterized protein with PQ loop repeat